MSIKITVFDEVNCLVEGLPPHRFNKLKDSLKYPVKGAHMSSDFQLGFWDGKESLIDEEGFTFQFFLEQIEDMLFGWGYTDDDVEIIDERGVSTLLPEEDVPIDYVKEETGYDYREHQHEIINNAIKFKKGVFDAATNAGKSIISLSLSKYFQDYLKSIVIVPTAKLVRQMSNDYEKAGLDYIAITSKISTNEKRVEKIRKHRHIIITSKLLNNILKYEVESGDIGITGNPFVVLYDELHQFGDTMIEAFRFHLNNSPVRYGMSGTVPDKDILKKMKILGCIGGDTIGHVPVIELIQKGYASKPEIVMVETVHKEIQEFCTYEEVRADRWNWDTEKAYYTNRNRVGAIKNYIDSLDEVNTLILCHPEMGNALCKDTDAVMIDKSTKEKLRDELFNNFDEKMDYYQYASFDTSGTGISKNPIFRIILIDVGKNRTHILQGIGRGLRLDGLINVCEIVDISADTYYAKKKHLPERKKLYKKEQLQQFIKNRERIIVQGD